MINRGAGFKPAPQLPYMRKTLFLLIPLITLSAQVVDTVIHFSSQPYELLYIPEGNELYVNFPENNYFFVLDCSTYIVKKIISRPAGYQGSAYGVWNEGRNKIYYSFSPRPDSIAVIDNENDSIIKWINFQSSRVPCYNSIDDKVYAFGGSRGVAVVDCTTDSIIKIITQPYALSGFVLWDSIGNKVYCGSGLFRDEVTVINCVNDSVIAIIHTNVGMPVGAVCNYFRRKLYVGGFTGDMGAVINAIADTLIKNYQSIFYDFEIPLIWNSLEDKVYWPNYDTIYVINCQNDSIVKKVELPRFGFDCISLIPWSNRLYVVSEDRDSLGNYFNIVYVLDCRNDSVISQCKFGKHAKAMTCNPIDQRIYIADLGDSSLYVFKDEMSGIDEPATPNRIAMTKRVEIYPNPVKSFLAVRLLPTADRQNLKIFDVAGKMIKEVEVLRSTQNDGVEEVKISFKGIIPGIYFLQLGTKIKKFLVVK